MELRHLGFDFQSLRHAPLVCSRNNIGDAGSAAAAPALAILTTLQRLNLWCVALSVCTISNVSC